MADNKENNKLGLGVEGLKWIKKSCFWQIMYFLVKTP